MEKKIILLNYDKNDWVIVPDFTSVGQVAINLIDSLKIDPSYQLFEDIYHDKILKNIKNRLVLISKLQIKYSTYQIKIKKYYMNDEKNKNKQVDTL